MAVDFDAYLAKKGITTSGEKRAINFDAYLAKKGISQPTTPPPAPQPIWGPQAAVGVGEAALNMGTGMIAKPVGEIAGLAALGKEMLAPTPGGGDPLGFSREVQQRLTYEPRTQAGKVVAEYNPLALISRGLDKVATAAGDVVGGDQRQYAPVSQAVGRGVAEALRQAPGIVLPMYAERAAATVPVKQAALDQLKAVNSPIDAIRDAAQGAGLRTGMEGGRALAGMVGDSRVNKATSKYNSKVVPKLLAEEFGAEGMTLTPDVLATIRKEKGNGYRAVTEAAKDIVLTDVKPHKTPSVAAPGKPGSPGPSAAVDTVTSPARGPSRLLEPPKAAPPAIETYGTSSANAPGRPAVARDPYAPIAGEQVTRPPEVGPYGTSSAKTPSVAATTRDPYASSAGEAVRYPEQRGFKVDDEFRSQMQNMLGDVSGKLSRDNETFGHLDQAKDLLQNYASKDFIDYRDAIESVKTLRTMASKGFKSDDSRLVAKALYQREIADNLDRLIVKRLEEAGKPEIAQNYFDARVKIKQAHLVEDALNPDGTFNVRRFVNLAEGEPLTGNLKLIYDAAKTYPESFQNVAKGGSDLTNADYLIGMWAAARHRPAIAVADIGAKKLVPMATRMGLLQARTPNYTVTPPLSPRMVPAAIAISQGTRDNE